MKRDVASRTQCPDPPGVRTTGFPGVESQLLKETEGE